MHHKLHSEETMESPHDRSNFEEKSTEERVYMFQNLQVKQFQAMNRMKSRIRKLPKLGPVCRDNFLADFFALPTISKK